MNIRDVLDRTDLASVLTELAGEPVTAGQLPRWRCCSADHPDEHPSVTMFRDRQGVERWKCWSGGHGGTAIDAVMVAQRVDIATAVRTLEERAGLTPLTPAPGVPAAIRQGPQPFSPAALDYATRCAGLLWTPQGSDARAWLHARGLTDQVLKDHLVGPVHLVDDHVHRQRLAVNRGRPAQQRLEAAGGEVVAGHCRHGLTHDVGVDEPVKQRPAQDAAA